MIHMKIPFHMYYKKIGYCKALALQYWSIFDHAELFCSDRKILKILFIAKLIFLHSLYFRDCVLF